MAWADTDYGYKKKIIIDHTKVAGDETDFTVLINVVDGDLADTGNGGHVQSSSGYDIVFYDSAESTLLNHQLQRYTNTNGTLICWVQITSLSSSTDTEFYVYYGKSGVGSDPSSTDTWDSNFQVVLHMNEASGTLNDKSGNGENFSLTAGSPSYQQTGKIGYGVKGNGTGYFDNTTLNVTGFSEMSIEIWYASDSQVANQKDNLFYSLYSIGVEDQRFAYKTGGTGTGDCGADYTWDDGTNEGGQDYSYNYTTSFIQYVSVCDADSFVKGYRNGSNVLTDNSVDFDFLNMSNAHCLGARSWEPAKKIFHGTIDEVRVHNDARDDNWWSTNYETQNDPANFMEFQTEESQGSGEETAQGYIEVSLDSSSSYNREVYIDTESINGKDVGSKIKGIN